MLQDGSEASSVVAEQHPLEERLRQRSREDSPFCVGVREMENDSQLPPDPELDQYQD